MRQKLLSSFIYIANKLQIVKCNLFIKTETVCNTFYEAKKWFWGPMSPPTLIHKF